MRDRLLSVLRDIDGWEPQHQAETIKLIAWFTHDVYSPPWVRFAGEPDPEPPTVEERSNGPAHDQAPELSPEDEPDSSSDMPAEQGLRPSHLKAYRLFQYAMGEKPELKTDRDVYDWLDGHTDLSDELPAFATWQRYVRAARAAHGDHKHTPRKAKQLAGKSIVRPNQIDQKRTEADR